MKTKKLQTIILIITMIIVGTTKGFSTEPENRTCKKVKTHINKHISYPEFAKEKNINAFVLVEYGVDSVGNVVIKGINASDNEFGKYVESQLQKVKFQSCPFEKDTSFICKYIFQPDNGQDGNQLPKTNNLFTVPAYLATK